MPTKKSRLLKSQNFFLRRSNFQFMARLQGYTAMKTCPFPFKITCSNDDMIDGKPAFYECYQQFCNTSKILLLCLDYDPELELTANLLQDGDWETLVASVNALCIITAELALNEENLPQIFNILREQGVTNIHVDCDVMLESESGLTVVSFDENQDVKPMVEAFESHGKKETSPLEASAEKSLPHEKVEEKKEDTSFLPLDVIQEVYDRADCMTRFAMHLSHEQLKKRRRHLPLSQTSYKELPSLRDGPKPPKPCVCQLHIYMINKASIPYINSLLLRMTMNRKWKKKRHRLVVLRQ